MRLPMTLFTYIGRQFLLAILASVLGLVGIAVLIDVVELVRRAAGKTGVPVSAIVQMAMLQAPNTAQKLLPFGVLIGSLLALSKLTRNQELVVARSAGVSVWQFLAPALMAVLALGLFVATVFNPLASVMLLKFEQLEGRYMSGKPSLLSISSSGLWVRQMEDADPKVGEHIIHALKLSQGDMSFDQVIVFTFDKDDKFIERLDADAAALTPGELVLKHVTRSLPGQSAQTLPEYRLATSLQMEHIQDSFADPETISFWKLPAFIRVLQDAGFPALRHRLYWQSLLASPFVYAGMVLIAALFSLRLPRFGRIGMLLVTGMITGFFLYFFTDITGALGMAGTLPVALAAWAPAAIIIMIGGGTLLHLEDG